MDVQNASVVCPESVRPLASVIVPEIMTGTRVPTVSKNASIANSAALAFSVSKIVSTSRMSAPPSSNPRIDSVYASTSASNVTPRAPGSSTFDEIDAVRFVGPRTPATNRGRPGSRASNSSATRRASAAPATFSSYDSASMP